ncbi:hypothetical protein GCM10007320_61450 [Pseudorhodoferax aquiterrae]|uniref:Uncharacterized protein n=1 Tax=Pseudorhodoferax aquiterrae TaxID=747304 RepID=A0ABQ3GD73_9BURK|nr:hypothetical protein [Pseudorhodoferax aquiterrae]GHD02313.1 hypothetical protein GCM10007320_61450 [Pseudorhodoferax aquiterrae]
MKIDEEIALELALALHAAEGGPPGPALSAFSAGMALGVLAKHIADLHKRIEQMEAEQPGGRPC